jgi:hypothetical protein
VKMFLPFGVALVLAAVLHADTRHAATVRAFQRQTGYPHGRPGYVVDHRIPLCAGGADAIPNLIWQPVAASYVKDGFERRLCVALKAQGYRLVKVDPGKARRR